MKTKHSPQAFRRFLALPARIATALFLTTVIGSAQSGDSRLGESIKQPWRAAHLTANQTLWQSMSIRTNVATQRLLLRTNSYVELGSGLNVRDAAGRFAPADPSFRVTMNGAEAHGTEHKVIVPADIWLGESIKVVQPGGESLAFQPLGIDYYDPSDGRSVLLDAVTNAGR